MDKQDDIAHAEQVHDELYPHHDPEAGQTGEHERSRHAGNERKQDDAAAALGMVPAGLDLLAAWRKRERLGRRIPQSVGGWDLRWRRPLEHREMPAEGADRIP